MPNDPISQDLAREFGRSLTSTWAPKESPFYDELIDAHSGPKQNQKDRALAFGVSPDGALALVFFEIGKVVLEGIWSAAKPMLAGIAKNSTDELRTQLSKKLKDWIQSKFSKPIPVTLSQPDIEKIITAVKQTASQQKLSDGQTSEVVQAISKTLGKAT